MSSIKHLIALSLFLGIIPVGCGGQRSNNNDSEAAESAPTEQTQTTMAKEYDYRIVARLNLIDNLGYKEVAEALDIPINTVKTRIRRAKAMLLKMMDYSDELL